MGLIFSIVDQNGPVAPPKNTTRYYKLPGISTSRRSSAVTVTAEALYYFFTKSFYFKIPQAYSGAGRRQKSPLDCATDFLSKSDSHLCVSFHFCFARKPKNTSWHVQMGPENSFFSFISNIFAGFFLYRADLVLTRGMLEKNIPNSNPNSTKR